MKAEPSAFCKSTFSSSTPDIYEHGIDFVIAVMFINPIRDEFQVDLPLLTLFPTPMIAAPVFTTHLLKCGPSSKT